MRGARSRVAAMRRSSKRACSRSPPAKRARSLETVRAVYDWLLEQRAERSATVVALGGGVVGRPGGLRRRDVPARRELRTGADVPAGDGRRLDRRQGRRRSPARQEPDRRVLSAAPRRAGHEPAEVAASALVSRGVRGGDQARADHGRADAGRARAQAGSLLAIEEEATTAMVSRNAALKAGVVSRGRARGWPADDPQLRAHGRATRSRPSTGYARILHGEAISAGMMTAAEIGGRMGVTPAEVGERQARLFELYGLPLAAPGARCRCRVVGDGAGQEGRREEAAMGAARGRRPARHPRRCLARPSSAKQSSPSCPPERGVKRPAHSPPGARI